MIMCGWDVAKLSPYLRLSKYMCTVDGTSLYLLQTYEYMRTLSYTTNSAFGPIVNYPIENNLCSKETSIV